MQQSEAATAAASGRLTETEAALGVAKKQLEESKAEVVKLQRESEASQSLLQQQLQRRAHSALGRLHLAPSEANTELRASEQALARMYRSIALVYRQKKHETT